MQYLKKKKVFPDKKTHRSDSAWRRSSPTSRRRRGTTPPGSATGIAWSCPTGATGRSWSLGLPERRCRPERGRIAWTRLCFCYGKVGLQRRTSGRVTLFVYRVIITFAYAPSITRSREQAGRESRARARTRRRGESSARVTRARHRNACDELLPSNPGTKHTQLVSIAPLTTSSSGSTARNISASPTT